jgi:bacterioferritin-associated ferredoxin
MKANHGQGPGIVGDLIHEASPQTARLEIREWLSYDETVARSVAATMANRHAPPEDIYAEWVKRSIAHIESIAAQFSAGRACGFCQSGPQATEVLIPGPFGQAICGSCLEICRDTLADEDAT